MLFFFLNSFHVMWPTDFWNIFCFHKKIGSGLRYSKSNDSDSNSGQKDLIGTSVMSINSIDSIGMMTHPSLSTLQSLPSISGCVKGLPYTNACRVCLCASCACGCVFLHQANWQGFHHHLQPTCCPHELCRHYWSISTTHTQTHTHTYCALNLWWQYSKRFSLLEQPGFVLPGTLTQSRENQFGVQWRYLLRLSQLQFKILKNVHHREF